MIRALGHSCQSLPVDWAESSLLVLKGELRPILGSLLSDLVHLLGGLRVILVMDLVTG